MIEALEDFPDNVVAFACRGHVTRQDYESVLVPTVEKKLEEHEKLRVYYEIGADFDGIDPGAVLEDIKVGMGHLSRWERIAVVTDINWIKQTMRAFGFLIPAEMKFFPMSEVQSARDWIIAP
jgi:hypothetical protein